MLTKPNIEAVYLLPPVRTYNMQNGIINSAILAWGNATVKRDGRVIGYVIGTEIAVRDGREYLRMLFRSCNANIPVANACAKIDPHFHMIPATAPAGFVSCIDEVEPTTMADTPLTGDKPFTTPPGVAESFKMAEAKMAEAKMAEAMMARCEEWPSKRLVNALRAATDRMTEAEIIDLLAAPKPKRAYTRHKPKRQYTHRQPAETPPEYTPAAEAQTEKPQEAKE